MAITAVNGTARRVATSSGLSVVAWLLCLALSLLVGWSSGQSAATESTQGWPSTSVYGYDLPTSSAEPNELSDVTRSGLAVQPKERAKQRIEGRNLASPIAHFGVAAKAGADALSPAIRANVDDAIQRAASGKIRFQGHDGKVYNNSDDLLPQGANYTEWTAAASGAKRGADRVIISGDPANPNAIYYWDHVNPPVRIGP